MVKTIYDPAYRKLIDHIKAQRLASGINQKQAGLRIQKSRQWIAKIEMYELRLDVLHFVRLCQAYHLKSSDLIKSLEEESSEDDFSLTIAFYDRLRLAFGGSVLLTLDNQLCSLWTFSRRFFDQQKYQFCHCYLDN
jgi:transcriptional regulator with XRE-family HTH domain